MCDFKYVAEGFDGIDFHSRYLQQKRRYFIKKNLNDIIKSLVQRLVSNYLNYFYNIFMKLLRLENFCGMDLQQDRNQTKIITKFLFFYVKFNPLVFISSLVTVIVLMLKYNCCYSGFQTHFMLFMGVFTSGMQH